MVFGFPAAYELEENLTVSRSSARDAVIHAFKVLGWNHVNPEPDLYSATVKPSFNSWGEEFTVSLQEPGTVRIKSSCRVFQLFDWGRNKQNVTAFLTHFSGSLLRTGWIGEKEPRYMDEAGNTPIDRVIASSIDVED